MAKSSNERYGIALTGHGRKGIASHSAEMDWLRSVRKRIRNALSCNRKEGDKIILAFIGGIVVGINLVIIVTVLMNIDN